MLKEPVASALASKKESKVDKVSHAPGTPKGNAALMREAIIV